MDLLHDPAFSLLGTYPEEVESECERDTCTSTFVTVQFTIVKTQNQCSCPSIDD